MLAQGKDRLPDGGQKEAEWLLAHILGWPQIRLITNATHSPTIDQQERYETLLLRRLQGEPLAYLLGRWEFWSRELIVGPAVLIPRPETELLVETALAYIPPSSSIAVADLGTGSGAIALALASERRACRVTATDCCPAALAVAKINAQRLGLTNIEFLIGDWCIPLAARRFHCIVSNPPYLATHDRHLNDLRFEPQIALTAGPDGLAAIRIIAATVQSYLYPGGMLLLEHGYDQGTSVRQLLAALNYVEIQTLLDLENRERVTICRCT
ncbi:Release factor glutamine methyltransferase [Gammaproteobacteria bacterium]